MASQRAGKGRVRSPILRTPRLGNGTYTHEVVPNLEAKFNCQIRFVAIDPRYPEDWEVRIDGEPVWEIGRRRDENGNTVYRVTADEFETKTRERLGS